MTLVFKTWTDLAKWTFLAFQLKTEGPSTVNKSLLHLMRDSYKNCLLLLNDSEALKPFSQLLEICLSTLEKVLSDPALDASLQSCLDKMDSDIMSAIPFTGLAEQIVQYQALMKASRVLSINLKNTVPQEVLNTGSSLSTVTAPMHQGTTFMQYIPAVQEESTKTAVAGPSQNGGLLDSSSDDDSSNYPLKRLEETSFYIYQKVRPLIREIKMFNFFD